MSEFYREGVREKFPPGVEEKLKVYVYRLIDPRNGETFYVGRGQGDRLFAHIRDEPGLDGDELDNRLRRIREIRNAGLTVAHVVHRHGMDAACAAQVEAALIDAYPGLTNIAPGDASGEFGPSHAEEIIRRYAAEEADFQHRALLINVNQSATETSLYEAVRHAWKLSATKAEQAEVVLAVIRGIIVGAFVADQWLPATRENFPGREEEPGRFGFHGREAPADIRLRYVGKRLPEGYQKPGAANPIRYTWW